MTDLGLYNFIKNALAAGQTEADITAILLKNYGQDVIDEAFASVKKGKEPVPVRSSGAFEMGSAAGADPRPGRFMRVLAKVLVTLLIIGVAIAAISYTHQGATVMAWFGTDGSAVKGAIAKLTGTQNADDGTTTYKNDDFKFSVRYPSGTHVTTSPVAINQQTTFVAMLDAVTAHSGSTVPVAKHTAKVTVLASRNPADVSTCLSILQTAFTNLPGNNVATNTVNGVPFLTYSQAYPKSTTTVYWYKAFQNGTCYQASVEVASEISSSISTSESQQAASDVQTLARQGAAIVSTLTITP